MKRTTTIVSLSIMLMVSSALAVGNAVLLGTNYGGIIDNFFTKTDTNINGDKVDEVLTAGKELAQEICENGDVLLKNINNTLPLEPVDNGYKVNIFGWGSSDNGFMYQGGGSSEGGYDKDKVSLYSAFRAAGFEINEDLVAKYNSLSYRSLSIKSKD